MAKVKIFLEGNETPEQAEDLIFKAFESQRNGEIHQDDFSDPAMQDALNKMTNAFKQNYDLMLQEIFQELDKEYKNDGDF